MGTPAPLASAAQGDRCLAGAGAIARLFRGVPLLALGAMLAIAVVNQQPTPVPGPRIDLRAANGGRFTALVFGAGSGIHFLRVSDDPRSLPADLARGPLRIVALHAVRLNAADTGDPNVVRLMASGHAVQLRRDGTRVSVRSGF